MNGPPLAVMRGRHKNGLRCKRQQGRPVQKFMSNLPQINQMGVEDRLKACAFACCQVIEKTVAPACHQDFVIDG
jgi:hypothetical protein